MKAIAIAKGQPEYIPALDGMRALSILLVLAGHTALGKFIPGGLGVIIFFVISGFLLTRLMIAEVENTGTLDIKLFYLRRVLRLAPALLLYIGLFGTVLYLLGAQIKPIHVFSGLFYFANYYHYLVAYTDYSPFPILWSLAVEEHFYILFPFLVFAFRRKLPTLLPWICLLLLAVPIWRAVLYISCVDAQGNLCPSLQMAAGGGSAIYYRTDTIFDCILYGVLLALLLHYRNSLAQKLIGPFALTAAIAFLLVSLIVRDAIFRDTLRYSIQAGASAVILINMLYGSGISAMLRDILSIRSIVFIGKLSYSLYLFHYGTLVLMRLTLGTDPHLTGIGSGLIYLVISFTLAIASYYWLEVPVKKLRRKFGSHTA